MDQTVDWERALEARVPMRRTAKNDSWKCEIWLSMTLSKVYSGRRLDPRFTNKYVANVLRFQGADHFYSFAENWSRSKADKRKPPWGRACRFFAM